MDALKLQKQASRTKKLQKDMEKTKKTEKIHFSYIFPIARSRVRA